MGPSRPLRGSNWVVPSLPPRTYEMGGRRSKRRRRGRGLCCVYFALLYSSSCSGIALPKARDPPTTYPPLPPPSLINLLPPPFLLSLPLLKGNKNRLCSKTCGCNNIVKKVIRKIYSGTERSLKKVRSICAGSHPEEKYYLREADPTPK